MPISPQSICTSPGCPNLTDKGRCKDHRREQRRIADKRRPTSTARGYDKDWQAFRLNFLKDHPLCECTECLKKPHYLRQIATEVDHIDGQGVTGAKGYDPANLQALSKSHHSRKTYQHDGSFGRPTKRAG